MSFNFFMFLLSLFSLLFFQVPAIAILLRSDVYLTYNGSDVTSFWLYALVIMLVISALRILLFNKAFVDTLPQGRFINFFVSVVMPKVSLLSSIASFTIFSGLRKLLAMKEQYLDNAVFWGNTMIHKRYDFQTRADYFDKLAFERSLDIPHDVRVSTLNNSSTMSDIFSNILHLEKYYSPLTQGEKVFGCLAIVGVLIGTGMLLMWLFSGGSSGGEGSADFGKIDSKHLDLDERVSRIETLLNSLGDEVKTSLLSGYAMSVEQDPEQFGRVIGAILSGFKKSVDKHDSLIISTFKRLYGIDYDDKTPTEPFSGKGHTLGGESKSSSLLDNLDE